MGGTINSGIGGTNWSGLSKISLFQSLLNILRPYGRMSLTSYIFQSFLGVFIFYGFGLGLYNYLGPALSMGMGVMILLFLLIFSNVWFRYFRYGPVEWLWRALTYKKTLTNFR